MRAGMYQYQDMNELDFEVLAIVTTVVKSVEPNLGDFNYAA